MAFFCNLCCSFFLASLSLAFLCTCSDPIEQVCPKTSNPTLCEQVLRADPRSAHAADVAGLADPAIGQALAATTPALRVVNDLVSQTSDATLLARYNNCLGQLVNTIGLLHNCTNDLHSKDYLRMAAEASSDELNGKACDRPFDLQPPSEPPQLKEQSRIVQDLCDVVYKIALILSSQ